MEQVYIFQDSEIKFKKSKQQSKLQNQIKKETHINEEQQLQTYELQNNFIPQKKQQQQNFEIIQNKKQKRNKVITKRKLKRQKSKNEMQNNSNQKQIISSIQKSLTIQIHINNIREFIEKPIQKGVIMTLYIEKQNNGFFNINPKYKIFFQIQNHQIKLLMIAKRLAAKANSQFLITTNPKNITTRQKQYLGKIKANFIGTQWIMYDNGVNPQKDRNLELIRKHLVYIKYQTNFFGLNGPRKMQVIIPSVNQNMKIKQIKPFTNQNILKYKMQKDRKSILVLENKQPEYDQKSKIFKLDFKGKVKHPSVKNFILIDQIHKQDRLIFGKVRQNLYIMEFKYPLSPFQAFGICLSSIDKKLLVQ